MVVDFVKIKSGQIKWNGTRNNSFNECIITAFNFFLLVIDSEIWKLHVTRSPFLCSVLTCYLGAVFLQLMPRTTTWVFTRSVPTRIAKFTKIYSQSNATIVILASKHCYFPSTYFTSVIHKILNIWLLRIGILALQYPIF